MEKHNTIETIKDNPSEAEETHCTETYDTTNPTPSTEEVASIINANIEKPTNINNDDKDSINPIKFNYHCEICQFKCKWMKSFKMHMLKNHSNTEKRYNSAEVTSAKNDTANITSADND